MLFGANTMVEQSLKYQQSDKIGFLLPSGLKHSNCLINTCPKLSRISPDECQFWKGSSLLRLGLVVYNDCATTVPRSLPRLTLPSCFSEALHFRWKRRARTIAHQSTALPHASGCWRQDETLAVFTATSFLLAHSLGVPSHTFVRSWNSFPAFPLEFLKLLSTTHHFPWLISRPLITRYGGR